MYVRQCKSITQYMYIKHDSRAEIQFSSRPVCPKCPWTSKLFSLTFTEY